MLTIVPIGFSEACTFVRTYHRHHRPPQGHKFSIGVAVNDRIVGVAIVGRPVARRLDNGWTLEVVRLCTDGTPNACSKLYSACWRIAREMGYRELITYILDTEKGISLKAAGWVCLGKAGGISWNVPARPRIDKSPAQMKIKFGIGKPKDVNDVYDG
ncbi:MAG TPA: XF1762 family protein [Puia sp.]|nr:XF1762 family protein [Puia sp.]